MLRTTCVATMLEGGHARNALPQLAAANVNCRVQPDDSLDYVMGTLKKAIADDQVKHVHHQRRRECARVRRCGRS